MARAAISLGSNMGTRRNTLREAIDRLAQVDGITLLLTSSFYVTEPVDFLEQPEFINAAVAIETELEPEVLLDRLQEIEQTLGRVRDIDKGPRTLDLDLLLYDDQIISTERLQVPHPRMSERRFVLTPLAEIVPDWAFPETGTSINTMLENCRDHSQVTLSNTNK